MSDSERKWYVLRAIGGKEKKVKEYVENEIAKGGLQGFVTQVLIPTEKVYQIRNGKNQQGKKLLPRLCACRSHTGRRSCPYFAQHPQCDRLPGRHQRGDPVPLRQNEVNRILGKVDELADTGEELNIPFVVGETIKVIDGPFNGFNGTIEIINEEKKKLQVMVKIFGRKTPLELSFYRLRRSRKRSKILLWRKKLLD